jgi:hypothetical protein
VNPSIARHTFTWLHPEELPSKALRRNYLPLSSAVNLAICPTTTKPKIASVLNLAAQHCGPAFPWCPTLREFLGDNALIVHTLEY